MRIRPLLHAGLPLPALFQEGAFFHGSCRIQPLEVSPEDSTARIGWIRIVGLDLEQSSVDPEVEVEIVRQVPAVRARMRLSQLTRPYPSLDRLLVPASPEEILGYQVRVAQALWELEVPIRAEIRPDWEVVRPASLFELTGEVPLEGVLDHWPRVRMAPPAESWRHHLGHLLDEDELETWCRAALDLGLPLRPSVLKQAVRRARLGEADVRGLPGTDQWPALECYAALSQKLLLHALSGKALHVAGHVGLTQLERELGNLRPGEEQLLLQHPTGVFVVARGGGGLDRTLSWRSSYAPGSDDRLERIARVLVRCPGVAFVSRKLGVSEAG